MHHDDALKSQKHSLRYEADRTYIYYPIFKHILQLTKFRKKTLKYDLSQKSSINYALHDARLHKKNVIDNSRINAYKRKNRVVRRVDMHENTVSFRADLFLIPFL